MDISNLTASILLADLQRRGFFKQPGSINDIIAASKLVSEILYTDDVNRDAGNEPGLKELSLVTIMDPPDRWGTRHNLGLAELAARLGSPAMFSRTGEVIAYDNFENGIEQWYRTGPGAWEVNWDAQYFKTGGFSCQLKTAVTVGFLATMTKHIGYPVLSPFGMEASFSYTANWAYLTFHVRFQSPTELLWASLRYNHATSKMQYGTAFGVWVDIPNFDFTAMGLPYAFDTLKLTVDFKAKKLQHLLINSRSIDLSAFSTYVSGGGSATPLISTEFILETNGGIAIGNIDDVIWTQNEPA